MLIYAQCQCTKQNVIYAVCCISINPEKNLSSTLKLWKQPKHTALPLCLCNLILHRLVPLTKFYKFKAAADRIPWLLQNLTTYGAHISWHGPHLDPSPSHCDSQICPCSILRPEGRELKPLEIPCFGGEEQEIAEGLNSPEG